MLKVLNFSHPLTLKAVEEITKIVGEVSMEIVPVNLHLNADLASQITAIVDDLKFSSVEWQTENFLVNLPGFAPAAALLLAELHGRMGYFPSLIRLVQKDGVFTLAELINLQAVRASSRTQRF